VLQIHFIYTENCKDYEEKVQISRRLYDFYLGTFDRDKYIVSYAGDVGL
jgi:hypothetical protein